MRFAGRPTAWCAAPTGARSKAAGFWLSGELNQAVDDVDLKVRHEGVSAALHEALRNARSDLTR